MDSNSTDDRLPPPEADAPRRRRFGVLLLPAIIFALGLGAGTAAQLLRDSDASDSELVEDLRESAPAWSWTANSEALLAGNYPKALFLCRAADAGLPTSEKQNLAYRTALAREGLEQYEDAEEQFRVASDSYPRTMLSPRAMMGQVRCLGRSRRVAEARELLARTVLLSGLDAESPQAILTDCRYLKAWLGVLECVAHPLPDPFNPRDSAWDTDILLLENLDRYLTGADTAPSEFSAVKSPDTHRLVRIEQYRVATPLLVTDAMTLVESVSAALNKRLCLEGDCRGKLSQIRVETASVALSPELFLEAIADLAGLEFDLEPAVVVLRARSAETDPRHRERAVQQALEAGPNHPLAPSARLWDANAAVRHDPLRAKKAYEAILKQHAPSAVRACAALNLGLIEFVRQNHASARDRFREAAAEQAGTGFQPLGSWWVGRTCLNEGRFEDARQHFTSAVAGKDPELRSAASLGIVLCDLLAGRPDSARSVLASSRIFSNDTHAAMADAMAAWLAFTVQPTDTRRILARDAAEAARFDRGFGLAGTYFAGQVFQACGAFERTEALYIAASDEERGPLAARMMLVVAEAALDRDDRAAARSRLLLLASGKFATLAAEARLKLAVLAERNGDGPECVAQSRLALQAGCSDRAAALRLLGRGYELQRRYRDAAQAYAGRLPDEPESIQR